MSKTEKMNFKVFETVPDLYLILSPHFEIINASNAYLSATLTTRKNIIGKNVFVAFPDNPHLQNPDGVQNLKSSLEKVLKEKVPDEMKLQRYDVSRPPEMGSGFETKYWKPTNTPVLNDENEVEYIIHKVIDVTDQLENEERLSSIFNQTSVGIVQGDLSNKIILVNKRYCEIVGWSKEELYQMRMEDFTYSEDLPENMALLERTNTKGIPFSIEKRYVRKDGSLVWVNINVTTIKDSFGNPKCFLGVCQDITERKQIEEALKQNEARLSRILEASSDGIWEWDFKHDIAWWNDCYSKILGINIPEAERSLRIVNEYIHPEDRHLIPEALKAHIEEGKKFEVEFRIVRPSGEIRYCLGKGKAIVDEQGDVSKLSGTLIDITDRKLAQEHLESKNKQLIKINNDLDNFIYTASHDLKAPISNIEGLIVSLPELVDEETSKNNEFHQIMELINKSIVRFKKTIEDLTDISKVQRNISEEESEVNIAEVIEDVKLSLKKEIESTTAIIKLKLDSIQTIHYSRRNIRSILYNLINNAIKYRSPLRQPYITISTEKHKEYILLCIEDNGLGIEPTKINQMFGMFKRLHDHVEGTGVGLYIVKRMIENSGGKIEVKSELGKGTTFKVYFKVN